MLLNTSLHARCTVRPNKLNHQSLEQRKIYCKASKETGGSCPQNSELPRGFQQSIFKGQVREGGLRVCDQLVHNSLID